MGRLEAAGAPVTGARSRKRLAEGGDNEQAQWEADQRIAEWKETRTGILPGSALAQRMSGLRAVQMRGLAMAGPVAEPLIDVCDLCRGKIAPGVERRRSALFVAHETCFQTEKTT